jgi:bacteriocin-like protein
MGIAMSKPISISDIDLTQHELSQHELQTINGGLTAQSLNPGRTPIAVGSLGGLEQCEDGTDTGTETMTTRQCDWDGDSDE